MELTPKSLNNRSIVRNEYPHSCSIVKRFLGSTSGFGKKSADFGVTDNLTGRTNHDGKLHLCEIIFTDSEVGPRIFMNGGKKAFMETVIHKDSVDHMPMCEKGPSHWEWEDFTALFINCPNDDS